MDTVCITGAFGNTAEPIINLLLKNDYRIVAFDLPSVKCPDWLYHEKIRIVTGNVCDSSIGSLFEDADAVIHLAVLKDSQEYTMNPQHAFEVNVYGTYNVLNIARKYSIPKVILAGSAPVHLLSEMNPGRKIGMDIDYQCSNGSDFTYDLTKHLQESMAKDFAKTFSPTVIVLRLGHIVDGVNQTDIVGVPLDEVTYCRGGWVCRHDVARAFQKAMEANLEGYHLFHIIGSYQAKDYFDLVSAEKKLGFSCKCRFADY